MSLFTKVGPDMTWSNPLTQRATALEWELRYGTPTPSDLLAAASLIASYRQMVRDPMKKRQQVVAALREDAT